MCENGIGFGETKGVMARSRRRRKDPIPRPGATSSPQVKSISYEFANGCKFSKGISRVNNAEQEQHFTEPSLVYY